MSLDSTFLIRLLSIALINVMLSGDNVIVLAMAAASLPRSQRRLAIVGGSSLAIVLRVGLTLVAAKILRVPALSAIGGLVLFWVAWGLLKADSNEPQRHDERPFRLRNAVGLIVIADITMSIDNVIAVAGMAQGDTWLLVAGLFTSMPLLMVTGSAVSNLISRFRWLAYLGATVITFTGAQMTLDNEPLLRNLGLTQPAVLIASLALAATVPLSFSILRGRRGQ